MKKFVAVLAAVLMSASFAQGQSLTGSYPAEGGAITVTSSGGVVQAAGLDFVSSNAGLVPTGGVPAPFAFLLSDTASQVTYGNLGSTVAIDGDLTLSVGATAGAEVAASWGMGAVPVAFPVAPIGGEEPLVSADLSGLNAIFAPDNGIWGGQVIDGAFTLGSDSGSEANRWPGGEAPLNAINGIGQKYLNFGKEGTGFVVSPAGPSTVQGLTFWAANDSPGRDPASYEIWGTNSALDPAEGFFDVAEFTAISTGDLALPESRNDGGDAALDAANAFSVAFDNSTEYSSYLVVFPSLKDAAENSMQIAEVQAYGSIVPEPASGVMLLMSVLGLGVMRRRRK